VHHDGVIGHRRGSLNRQAIALAVFTGTREKSTIHALVLDAQHHHRINTWQNLI
jgi:hypothetical protein